jgi:transcriptional regulator with XRE-family HTH domain
MAEEPVGRKASNEERSPIAQALDYLLKTHLDASGKHVTVEDVAAAIDGKGISATYLYALRSGAKRNPTVATLQALAHYFGVHVGYFFGGSATSPTGAPEGGPSALAPVGDPAVEESQPTAPAAPSLTKASTAEDIEPVTAAPLVGVNLAARLEHLFTLRLRTDGSPWSMRQVSLAAKKRGVALSVGFLHDLRRGIKDNPTKQQLECLAQIFDVRPGYFFDDDDTLAEVNEKLRTLGALDDDRVAYIALRSKNLSTRDFMLLNALIDTAIGEQSHDSPEAQRP